VFSRLNESLIAEREQVRKIHNLSFRHLDIFLLLMLRIIRASSLSAVCVQNAVSVSENVYCSLPSPPVPLSHNTMKIIQMQQPYCHISSVKTI
jgi:hypothetical protein